MPKDRVTMLHQGYGFVEFMGEEDADYSIKIMNMIKLYGKPIRVNKASSVFVGSFHYYLFIFRLQLIRKTWMLVQIFLSVI